MASESLVHIGDRAVSGLERAEEIWDNEKRAAVARYLGVSPTNPAIVPMLAVCAAWGLDPFAGQVWLIKQKGRSEDGAERWRPSAGRDGYLAIANRQPDFKGLQGDVVRQNDHFKVTWRTDENGMYPHVEHGYEQGRADDEPKLRGEILGAWAIIFRRDRLPVYYFAPWMEHRRDPDKTAWSYKSAMILKAAQSMALRLGYSITGLVPYDEVRAGAITEEADGSVADITLEDRDVEPITGTVILPAAVEDHLRRAAKLGRADLADRARAEMEFAGQAEDFVIAKLGERERELAAWEAERAQGAAVNPPDANGGEQTPSPPEDVLDDDAVVVPDEVFEEEVTADLLRGQANLLLDKASVLANENADENVKAITELEDQAQDLIDRADEMDRAS